LKKTIKKAIELVIEKTIDCRLVGLLIFLFIFQASAESVFVRPPQADGETGSYSATVYELIKAEVSKEPGFALEANAKSASIQLAAKLLKLGNSFILSIDKIKGDQIVFTAKMKASTIDDLDTVSARVVSAVLREIKVEGSAQIDDVTEDEVTRGTRRIQTVRQWRLAFGPAWGSNLNTTKSGTLGAIGYAWGLDAQWEALTNMSLGGFSKEGESGAYYVDGMLGISYFLTKGKHSPYVTGGFGYASAGASRSETILLTDDKASGWAIRTGVGVKLFRTTNLSFGFELNHSLLFAKTSVSGNMPGLTSLFVVLAF
jgi:hypothetical protein